MSGFPTRTNRSALGPALENMREVTDPRREIGADTFELAWWNLMGLTRTGPLSMHRCTVSGGVVTVASQSLAWDPAGALSNITFTYEAAGRYSFAFASTYPDQRAVAVATVLRGGFAASANQAPYRGDHTGLDNAASLTDSAQAWTVNALTGKRLFNLTDGSVTTITSNTADTAVGVLAGGADNDWDNGDEYVVVDPNVIGYVQMISNYAGEVIFMNGSEVLTDPSAFMLVLY
jgi:hypothetical protein